MEFIINTPTTTAIKIGSRSCDVCPLLPFLGSCHPLTGSAEESAAQDSQGASSPAQVQTGPEFKPVDTHMQLCNDNTWKEGNQALL